MKFSLMSDLHVDFPQQRIPYDELEEIVVVAGDTSNSMEGLRFLNKLRRKGHTVVACDGNHESYRNAKNRLTVYETSARFREDNPSAKEIHGVPFVAYNGWYFVSEEPLWQNWMNDGRCCNLTAEAANKLAVEHAEYVEEKLILWRDLQCKGVVITHTAPCLDTLNPQYDGHFSNEWYWNPAMRRLIDLYPNQILVWCHGHTHASNNKIVNGVRVVCNPRGYPGENPGWKPLTIEV